jgi:hypothetical protein
LPPQASLVTFDAVAQKVWVGPAKATPTANVESTPGLCCSEHNPSANGEVPRPITQGILVAPAIAAPKPVGWPDEQEFELLLSRSTYRTMGPDVC